MPIITIVSPDVKSQLGLKRHKPWMAPGSFTEIGAMIPRNWKIETWDECVQGPVPDELIISSDLLALTFLTPSRYRAIDIADFAKNHGIQVIAGGRDIIGWCREDNGISQIHNFFPSMCATTLSPDLMAEILSDADKKRLRPYYELPADHKIEMVLPRRDLIVPNRYYAGYTLRSSEGCNMSCPWCTVGGRGYHFKNPAVLTDELKTVRGSFFLDTADSFAGNPAFIREEVLPLYKASRKLWGTEIAVTDALGLKNGSSLIEPMAKAGCRLLYFGLESVTRNLGTNKSSRATAQEAIKECRRVGIVTVGALIIDAFGDETVNEIEEMILWAQEWLDFAQFSLVAALPGCALRRKALRENRIINQGHENWEYYDGAHPTIMHHLSPELRRLMWHKAYTEFSQFGYVLKRGMRAQSLFCKIGVLLGGIRYAQEIPKYTQIDYTSL